MRCFDSFGLKINASVFSVQTVVARTWFEKTKLDRKRMNLKHQLSSAQQSIVVPSGVEITSNALTAERAGHRIAGPRYFSRPRVCRDQPGRAEVANVRLGPPADGLACSSGIDPFCHWRAAAIGQACVEASANCVCTIGAKRALLLLSSWTPEESQVERCEHQDDANVHCQPFPESVSEERKIHTDYDGCHCHHVKRDSGLLAHVSLHGLYVKEGANVRTALRLELPEECDG
jgi:hypothetical protein